MQHINMRENIFNDIPFEIEYACSAWCEIIFCNKGQREL